MSQKYAFSLFIYLFISYFVLLISGFNLMSAEQNRTITIIYNNIESENGNGYRSGHGFAAWIKCGENNILFDTGGDSCILMDNIREMGADVSSLVGIVISHNHWDHVFGLPGILKAANNKPIVYLPKDSGNKIHEQFPGLQYTEVMKPVEISRDIWVTGPIPAVYKNTSFYEQALIIVNNKALTILVGCSHPGIVEIVNHVKEMFPGKSIENIIGGFHLINKDEKEVKNISDELKKLDIKNISSSHCTGNSAIEILKNEWQNNYCKLCLGDTYNF